ncbi:DUF5689 domain-containing protein [Pseudochryseolinea flava]|uniref:Por secretion system C-terminal sorting domain-containing protein n=1 Tax=Pseudochryseolinea flava TaxID=2059302 RepID=A0A364XXS7_9BACT|nr:DUF5689 domain-containing protein [Pseudochryseolinea flava]RAV99258.1 hypothetical protein DQQ10_20405 [Pseudochryseolinea flava]
MRLHYSFLFLFLCATISHLHAQISLFQINASYRQDFDSLLSTGTTNDFSTFPHGWVAVESGTNANTTYASSTGSANAGNTYSFGTNGERSFGGLQSGSLIPTVGAGFVNNTGTVINALQISYRGEQWRLGAVNRIDRLDFQYSLDATSLTTGTWSDLDALDFNGPISTGTAGALNGNDSLSSTVLITTIDGLTITPGTKFFIRWNDFNAGGADDGLSIDDFSITPIGIDLGTTAITFSPASLNFGDVIVGSSDTLSYHVAGKNLPDSIAVFTFGSEFSISVDGVTFSNSLTLLPTGGRIVVKFTPTRNGLTRDSILHVSDDVQRSISLTGNGFVQAANIIPIAAARTQPIGTRVTVAGRITVANQHGNPAYIQDVTGGIPVFDYTMASSVEIGDSIIVTGPIGVFNNQVQISGSNIIFTDAGGPQIIRAPKVISPSALAAHEGQLVTVRNVRLVNTNFVFYPQSTEIITNDTTSIDLRIDGDTDIPGLTKPQGIVDITGVVGRFRSNAQLLPRFRADIPGADEPTVPSDTIPKHKTLDIVNWNLEFFGATREDYPEEYGPADEALQLANVKQVLDSLQADIIAVQEISDDSSFFALVRQLGHYKGVCSDRFSYSFDGPSNFPPQKVCYIYDTLTVSALSSRALFENLYDSARLYDASLLPGYPGGGASSFYSSGRLPFLLKASINISGVETIVSLIDIHAKSGSTPADHARRLYDAAVLKDTLDTHFANTNFIILGDLNDDLDQSITSGLQSPYQAFVNDTARYSTVTKVLSEAGARSTVSFNDVIDHQIISNEMHTQYIDGAATIITPFGTIPNYGNTTSDHLPVITRYSLTAPRINFVSAAAAVAEVDSSTYRITLRSSKRFSSTKTIAVHISGNAIVNEDYVVTGDSLSSTIYVTLESDSLQTHFDIRVVDDFFDETNEKAIFTIQPGYGFVSGDSSMFALTITDNDIPEISFAKIISSAFEGSGDQTIQLKLSTPVATEQHITLQVTNALGASYGSDYTTTPSVVNGKITLPVDAGSNETSFVITPLSDSRREIAEVVTFKIASVSSGITAKNPTVSVFTILDSRLRNIFMNVAPNPTTHTAKLVTEGIELSAFISLELRSSTGELLLHTNGALDKVNDVLESSFMQLKRGIYIIKVVHQSETHQFRLVKS